MLSRFAIFILTVFIVFLACSCTGENEAEIYFTDGDLDSETALEDMEVSESVDGNSEIAAEDREELLEDDGEIEEIDPYDYPDGSHSRNRAQDIAYLIVTDESMTDAFDVLAQWKIRKGIPTVVRTMQEIIEVSEGVDEAEKLRNYIIEMFDNEPLQWVLLGGDTPLVPHREFWAEVSLAGQYDASGTIASDLYFADLDGSWDDNGNGIWGEMEDNLDLWAELYVSRAPVDNSEEAAGFIAKTMAYEQNPPEDFIHNAVFISENTGFSGLDSSLGLNPLAGHFPDDYSIRKLYLGYDHYADAEPNKYSNQWDAFSSGPGFFAHFGHGSGKDVAALHLDDIHRLDNGPKNGIFVSTACLSGGFHNHDQSGGEAIVVNPNGGTVAYFGNTEVGIGFPSGMNYIYEVYKTLFDDRHPVYRLAELYTVARENFTAKENLYKETHTSRWTVMEMVLFGEPEMQVWADDPTQIEATHLGLVRLGKNRYMVQVESDGEALEAAQVSISADGLLISEYTDEDGQADLRFELSGDINGLSLTVTKDQYRPLLDEIEIEE